MESVTLRKDQASRSGVEDSLSSLLRTPELARSELLQGGDMFDEVPMENTVTTDSPTVERARDYERRRFEGSRRMRRLDRLEREFAKRLFDTVGTDAYVVDIPCGTGRFFEIFSLARTVVLIDYSDVMLQVFQERYGQPDNSRIIRADISSIPLADNVADLCFCMRLLHHMKDDRVRMTSLRELARISRKYVAVSFYDAGSVKYRWRRALGKKIRGNHITYTHLQTLAERVGLRAVEHLTRRSMLDQQSFATFVKL